MKTKTVTYTGNNTLLNTSLTVLVVLLVLAVGSHLYSTHFGSGSGRGYDSSSPIIYPPRQIPMFGGGGGGMGMGGFIDSGNGVSWPPDVLRNPYAAPMKDERYLVGPPMFPINVSTNPGAVDASYRQVGVLSPNIHRQERHCSKCKMGKCDGSCGEGRGGGGDDLLILMGRPLFTNRDTWQYYAISNQRNGVKLPIRVGGKNATNEYGVRELNGGDVITVDGYNKRYQVEMYETDTIRYLPYM